MSQILVLGHAQVHDVNAIDLREEEVEEAFELMISHEGIQESHRFCFYLDALDEFDDSPQYDYQTLANMLKHWVQSSCGNIKICVSSREENVFESAFTARNRIRLQDLTRRDMERYVHSKLTEIESAIDVPNMVKEVVDRSEGVFLWTVLVVGKLRECLDREATPKAIGQELASLPTEIEGLFKSLVSSIGVSAQPTAYRIFILMFHLARHEERLPLLSCLFLEHYSDDPDFATTSDELLPSPKSFDDQTVSQIHHGRISKAKKTRTGLLQRISRSS
jgi:hypothetical protein